MKNPIYYLAIVSIFWSCSGEQVTTGIGKSSRPHHVKLSWKPNQPQVRLYHGAHQVKLPQDMWSMLKLQPAHFSKKMSGGSQQPLIR